MTNTFSENTIAYAKQKKLTILNATFKKLVKLKVAFGENKENSYIVGFTNLAN